MRTYRHSCESGSPRGGFGLYLQVNLTARYNQSYTEAVKTAVSIPDPVFHEAEALARRLGLSRSRLFREALEAYIAAHSDKKHIDALNEVYSREPSSVDSGLSRMQWASLPEEEW